MIACYDSDVLFYAGLSIGLWIASVVGMGCAMLPFRKKSYADQIEEMMFEHIVQQLRGINIAEAYEVESEDSDSEEQEQEQVESDEESEAQEQEESEESTDADNEEEQEQDIEYVEETQIDNLPDHVEEPPAPVEAPLLSESSDDSARPSKRARRGRGRGRGHT